MTSVLNQPDNFAKEKLSAVDFEASYGFEAAGGNFDLRTLWTYTDEHTIEDVDGNVDNLLGEIAGGNAPGGPAGPTEWKSFTSLGYAHDNGFKGSLRYRFVGAGVIGADWVSGVDIDNNKVDAVHYFDLGASKSFDVSGKSFEIFANVDNIFDAQPPSRSTAVRTYIG